MCNKSGFPTIPPVSVAPGVQTPSAANNSSAETTFIKDSIHTVVQITVTSGAALFVGFIILLVVVLVLHRLIKTHHHVHSRRLNTLASLTGYGEEHIHDEKLDNCSTGV